MASIFAAWILLAIGCTCLSPLFVTPEALGSGTFLVWGTDPISLKYQSLLSTAIPSEIVSSAAIDGDLVAVGTDSGQLSVWKIDRIQRRMTPLSTLATNHSRVTALQVNESSNMILCYGAEGVRLEYQLQADNSLLSVSESDRKADLNCESTESTYPSHLVNGQCRLDCSQIAGALSQGSDLFQCKCNLGFQWNGEGCTKIFESDCVLFENAIALIENGECSCTNAYVWTGYQCQSLALKVSAGPCIGGSCDTINCAQVDNSPHTNFDKTSCNCNAGFIWDSVTTKCLIDCSAVSNAVAKTGDATCSCKDGFVFQNLSCVRDCSTISEATSVNPNRTDECICKTPFSWSATNCTLNCSLVDGAGSASGSGCNCNSGRTWNPATYECQPNASSSKLPLVLGLGVGIPAGLILIAGIVGLVYFVTNKRPPPQPPALTPGSTPASIYTMKSLAGTTMATLPPISSQLPATSRIPSSQLPVSSSQIQYPPMQSRLALTSEVNIRPH